MQAQKKAFLEACFFTIFLDFDLKNNQFFNGFLLRSSIQIALIFGALSPSQSIVFKLVFDTFEHRMQKMISYKNMYFPHGKSLFLRFRALRKTANLANK